MRENVGGRQCFSFPGFRLYPDERLLLRDATRIHLTPRVMDLLVLLVTHHGRLVSKEQVFRVVWPDSFVEEGNINRAVSTLRKILGSQENGSGFIETVPKAGYRFIAPVHDVIEVLEPAAPNRSWIRLKQPVLLLAALTAIAAIVSITVFFVQAPVKSAGDSETTLNEYELVPNEPLRLTFDSGRRAFPRWTDTGQIRYQDYSSKAEGESYIIDPDGRNRVLSHGVPGLRQGVWSPNGKFVYFWKHGDHAVYLAKSDGSDERKLPFEPGNMDWSPDSDRIVFQSSMNRGTTKDFDIFTYDIASGKIVDITNNPAVDADPAFSPDGKRIVFNSNRDGNFEIYLMNADGSDVSRLTEHPAWDSHPAFSPDGTQIIFNSNRNDENYDLYVMRSDGSGLRKLTDWESHEEIGPGCWSSDGTRIVLISDHDGDSNVYVMNVEPFRPLLKFADTDANIGAATYSPDGKRIVYQAELLADKSGELRVQDIVSGEVHTLLKTANSSLQPEWSADGHHIVFQNKIGGATSLYQIDPAGNGLSRITDNATADLDPAWSPDGNQIVFVADYFGRNRVSTVDVDTGKQWPLTPKEGWERDPAWSPDGAKIAFSCDREDAPGNGLDLCLMDADGGNEKRLLSRRGHDMQPAWSPDGSRLAFVATSDGNAEIYTINVDGTGLLRLTRNLAEDSNPHWSHDGTRIIFTSRRSGQAAIYEIEL